MTRVLAVLVLWIGISAMVKVGMEFTEWAQENIEQPIFALGIFMFFLFFGAKGLIELYVRVMKEK